MKFPGESTAVVRLFPPARQPGRGVVVGSALVLGLLVVAPAAMAAAPPDDLLPAAEKLRADFVVAIRSLADGCERRGMQVQAQKTRSEIRPQDPYMLFVSLPPKQAGPLPLPEGVSPELAEWYRRYWQLKTDYAAALFDLARRAAKAQRASLAYELAIAAIQANPDHEGLRRIMGHQKYKNQWCTAYEAKRLRAGSVWHERFGWISESFVPRYERGERNHGGRWVSAEEDARLHRDIGSGWTVETEHYLIHTNHSLESGVALGAKLERFFLVWQQLFVRYFATEAQVISLFEGRSRAPPSASPRLHVVFFRDREDFKKSLRQLVPNIDMAIGMFLQTTGRAYFFAGEESGDRTLYHEATHQLFHHARPVAKNVGARANFWIVEGIAMFMESLRERDGYFVLGGLDDERVYASQVRLIRDNFYVPFAELTSYGMVRIQADPRISTLYSQAAGQTNFLVFHGNGRYRDALVGYLSTVYSGQDTPETLSILAGPSFEQLDREYRDYTERAARFKQSAAKPADSP